ncbi:MAG: response regulator [Deltaproteobacteria bacterium]|nr:response regulator [Deltaproteobacteria bacterium]
MPCVLTVDDSRAVRTIVAKQVKDLGFDVDEAEDGIQGLAKLQDMQFDLVLLDVTMPNMDGPTMLAKMREQGNQTPVIMLTSESKRSVVGAAMKAGINDYILKPFKPEELRNKILTVLQGGGGDEDVVAASSPGGAPAAGISSRQAQSGPAEGAAKQFIDVMLVDDMENVHKRMRGMLPQHLTMNAYTSAQSALAAARDRVYRVVIVDTEIPDVNSPVLAGQIKVLQPHAAFVALALRTANDQTKELKDQGFSDVLYKPFTQDTVDDFLGQYFDNNDFLISEDNVLKVAPFNGKPERLERYVNRLNQLFPEVLNKVAAACYEDIVIDFGAGAMPGDRLPKLLIGVSGLVKSMGMEMSVVASADAQKMLSGFEETKAIKVYGSLQEARAALG